MLCLDNNEHKETAKSCCTNWWLGSELSLCDPISPVIQAICKLHAYAHLSHVPWNWNSWRGWEGQGEKGTTEFLVTVSKIHICKRNSHFRYSFSKTTVADRQEVQFQMTSRQKIGQINNCSLKGVGGCAPTKVTENTWITNGQPKVKISRPWFQLHCSSDITWQKQNWNQSPTQDVRVAAALGISI